VSKNLSFVLHRTYQVKYVGTFFGCSAPIFRKIDPGGKRLEPKRLLLMSTQKIQILEWAGIPNQSNIETRNNRNKMKRMKSLKMS